SAAPPARSNNVAEPAARETTPPAARENPSAPRPNVYTNENIPRAPQPASTEQPNSTGKEREATTPQQKPAEQPKEVAPSQQRPPVKFAPPPRAKDENYDVHPPLNNKSEAPQQEHRQAPPPKSEPKSQSKEKDSKPKN
ncbi:MAG: hypothetical protein WB117_14910, partial [Candidatus Acidiferrales bacterium]